MGFIARRKPRRHLKIVLVKKRLAKCIKKFKKNREELVQLHLRNRIKHLVIEELERRLADVQVSRKDRIRTKTGKSLKAVQ